MEKDKQDRMEQTKLRIIISSTISSLLTEKPDKKIYYTWVGLDHLATVSTEWPWVCACAC